MVVLVISIGWILIGSIWVRVRITLSTCFILGLYLGWVIMFKSVLPGVYLKGETQILDWLKNVCFSIWAFSCMQLTYWRVTYVAETVKVIPDHLVTYKVFGQPDGPHYAHYDLVGGRLVSIIFAVLKLTSPYPTVMLILVTAGCRTSIPVYSWISEPLWLETHVRIWVHHICGWAFTSFQTILSSLNSWESISCTIDIWVSFCLSPHISNAKEVSAEWKMLCSLFLV